MCRAEAGRRTYFIIQLIFQLAKNPSEQERLREEIQEATQGGEISFDDLIDMEYLDAVIQGEQFLSRFQNILKSIQTPPWETLKIFVGSTTRGTCVFGFTVREYFFTKSTRAAFRII